jgi:pimeloyl-ACP methyl ester carboxylesterase
VYQPRRPPLRQTLAEAVALLSPTPTSAIDQLVAHAPQGDGHAVLVLPALLRGDRYTESARSFLTGIGYIVYGWDLGINIGPAKRLLDGSLERLRQIAVKHGPVSLVGFSLGGLFARWLSLQSPQLVRDVITLCSPIHDAADSFWLPLKPFLGMWPDVDVAKLAQEIARPLPVPLTCVVSRTDGIVHWTSCCDHGASPEDVIEITGPHALIARSPAVLSIVAERLARATPNRTSGPPPSART